jgi:integrase
LFILETGIRFGEARALKWSDVDPESRTVRIQRSWSPNRGIHEYTKTKKWRDVDCNTDRLAAELEKREAWYKEKRKGKVPEWAFIGSKGRPLDYRSINYRWHSLLEDAGVRDRGMHCLRDTYASGKLSDGEPLLYVSEQLGHEKPSTTLKYYAKWIPRKKKTGVKTGVE